MNFIEEHTANPQKVPMRMQEYGLGIFKSLPSKTALKKALKQERILVDGKVASTATFIYGKELIALKEVKQTQTERSFRFKLQVLYEDDYLAVVYKPAGLLVSGNSFKTLAKALEQNLSKSTQQDAVPPHPVHRLDFPTTGLVLVGKTASSLLLLGRLFQQKEIEKRYMAVTIGSMKKEGVIRKEVDGKVAVSHFKVLKTVASKRFQYLNLVDLRPQTGRRHQLRKHLHAIGNPILGDAMYYKEKQLVKGKGLYLHAFSLTFKHPITTAPLYVEAVLPSKFHKIFD